MTTATPHDIICYTKQSIGNGVHESCFSCRVYIQFTLEAILSTAFGHQAEILRGKAENDELYKAACIISTEAVDFGGPTGFLAMMAIQCKLSFPSVDTVVKVSSTMFMSCLITAHIPRIFDSLVKRIAKWFIQPPSKALADYSKKLIQARRCMNPSNRVCYNYNYHYIFILLAFSWHVRWTSFS